MPDLADNTVRDTGLPDLGTMIEIADRLAEGGLRSIEIRTADGSSVRLSVAAAAAENSESSTPPSSAVRDAPQSATAVTAPYFGRLWLPERLRTIDGGAEVEAGECVAQLRLHTLCVAVLAPCSGPVTAILRSQGALVGLDDVVMRIGGTG